MRPAAVDANAIHQFQEERVRDQPGAAHLRFETLLTNDCIALDENGHCMQEWVECAGGKFPFALTDWIDAQLIIGKIRLFPLADNTCRKHLLSLGMPQKDHKWVRLAIGSDGRHIITNDVDFFDPTAKSASSAKKDHIKRNGGKCSKQLRKIYGIEVESI